MALPVHWVTGSPVEAGAGLAAVVPVGEGWAGCRRGQSGAWGDRSGSSSWAPGPLWPLCPSLAWASLGDHKQGPHAGLCGQAVCRGGHLAAPDSQARPRERVWHHDCPPAPYTTQSGRPHALWAHRGPWRPAGQRQEPLTASQGAPAAQSQARRQSSPKKPAGQAARGGGGGAVTVTGQVTRPIHTPGWPPAPAPPRSPRSQKVPLQPAGQVQAPLTWSQAPPCSHWQRRPQPGPKWPWGHPGRQSPAHHQLGDSEPPPPTSCLGLRHPSGPQFGAG